MARRVLRFDIAVDDRPHLIPEGPIVGVYCFAADTVTVWVEVARLPSAEQPDPKMKRVRVFGTGQPIDSTAGLHQGLAVWNPRLGGDRLVWHLYEMSE